MDHLSICYVLTSYTDQLENVGSLSCAGLVNANTVHYTVLSHAMEPLENTLSLEIGNEKGI